jgi:hypothetical protein
MNPGISRQRWWWAAAAASSMNISLDRPHPGHPHNTVIPASPPRPNRPGYRLRQGILSALTAALAAGAGRADAAPPTHNVAAASLNVAQNDAGNSTASVTLSTPLRINGFKIRPGSNRGDYNIQIGDDSSDDVAGGVLMTCTAENGRDNSLYGETTYAGIQYVTTAIEANSGDIGYYIPLFNCGWGAEFNANVAGAWFPYSTWLGGWARNASGTDGATNSLLIASPSIVHEVHFVDNGGGRSTVDLTSLGYHSQTDGILLVTGGNNEDNYAASTANTNGTWTIFCRDNGSNGAGNEQDCVAFVFLPRTNTTVISGRFKGDATVLMHSGETPAFSVSHTDLGTWRLTIPGNSPTNGVLIISAEGGGLINSDNIVNYQPDGDGWIITSRDIVNATSRPVLETPTDEPAVSFVFIPGPTPGFAVAPTNGLITTESGGSASFAVNLDAAPAADVVFNVTASDATEGAAAVTSLTFTPYDWDIPQTVTVTGADDSLLDGPVAYSIVLAPANSADPGYHGLDPADVGVVNIDNDLAGVTLIPTTPQVTTEATGYASFTLALNIQPTADVTIGLATSNPNEGVIYVPSLVFTPTDWNLAQTVTVFGADDFVDDGDTAYSVVFTPAISADPHYQGLTLSNFALVNLDNDTAALLFSPTNNLEVTEGSTTTYTVALATKPLGDVTAQASPVNLLKGTVSPASLTFTPDNWSQPQTFTLTGVDNLAADGPASYFITNSVSSADPVYAALPAFGMRATTLDNEAALTVSASPAIYGLGMPAIGLDGRATLVEPDTTVYDGGSLVAAITANGTAEDALEIRPAGSGVDQISVTGGEIGFGGTTIGTFSGGAGTSALTIALNNAATPAAVQQLVRSLTFRTGGASPSEAPRTVQLSFNDGLGATQTVSKVVRVGLLRLTQFQEGADHGYGTYSGAADIALSQVASSTPWPMGRNPAEGLLVDAPDAANASHILLRFTNLVGEALGQIPTNAVIVAADLQLFVLNSGDGGTLHRLLVPWDADNATWLSMGGGVQLDGVQARAEFDSQWGVSGGSGSTREGTVTVSVTPDVQAWFAGASNHGWAVIGWTNATDGTGVAPSESANLTQRPHLQVYWLPAGATSASFRQGVDGYGSAQDTRIREVDPDNNTNAWSVTSLFVDGAVSFIADPEQVLLKFEHVIGTGAGQVPPGARVHAAFLDLGCVINNAPGQGGEMFALLQPWTDTNSTWNTWGNGVQTDGVEAASVPTAHAGSPTPTSWAQGGFLSFEMTPDVQAWANGAANHGWVMIAWLGSTDGWGFGSSESIVERDRPRLRVFYTSHMAVITGFARTGARAEMQFRGTAGKTYSVERAPTLNGPWSSLGSVPVGMGGEASYTDVAPLPGNGFYRVVLP